MCSLVKAVSLYVQFAEGDVEEGEEEGVGAVFPQLLCPLFSEFVFEETGDPFFLGTVPAISPLVPAVHPAAGHICIEVLICK